MTPDLIDTLITAAVPILGAIGLFIAKQFLNLRDIQLTNDAEEVARVRITDAIERVAGAIRHGEIRNMEDGVSYIQDRFVESLEKLGMNEGSIVEMVDVEIGRQSAPVNMQ